MQAFQDMSGYWIDKCCSAFAERPFAALAQVRAAAVEMQLRLHSAALQEALDGVAPTQAANAVEIPTTTKVDRAKTLPNSTLSFGHPRQR